MAIKLKADVLQALDAWKAGKPVRSVELGHVHCMKEVPGFSPTIDDSEHIHCDQERAHAYLFHLIELFSINGVPESHDAFLAACDEYEQTFDWGESPLEKKDALNSERDGAESLVWKALRFGWARAIEGHKDSMYIEVAQAKQESKSKK